MTAKKKLISMRIAERTENQLRELTRGTGLNQTEVIALALDHLYLEETGCFVPQPDQGQDVTGGPVKIDVQTPE